MAKSNIFRVSFSKINCWRGCRYRYWLRYVEKLRKKRKARPLQFGSLVHTMAEEEAYNRNPFKKLAEESRIGSKLFASEREEWEEIVRDVRQIMTEYFDFWEEQPAKLQLTYLKVLGKKAEQEIVLDLCEGIEIIAKLDNIATTGDDRRWLVERKTFRNMPSDDHRWRNLQTNVYDWALKEAKIEVDGICWDYIRNKSPTVPQIKKNGDVSEKRLDTLPITLREFFKEHKIDAKGSRMIAAAKSNRNNYFSRVFTSPKKATVKMLLADVIETAKEMRELHGRAKAKTIDRHCDWCEYEPICRAELTGADANFIRKKEYQTRAEEEREIAQAD